MFIRFVLLLVYLVLCAQAEDSVAVTQELLVTTGQQLIDGVTLFGLGEHPFLKLVLGTNVSVGALPFPTPNDTLTFSSGKLLIISGNASRSGPVYLDARMRSRLAPQFPASTGRASLELTNFTM